MVRVTPSTFHVVTRQHCRQGGVNGYQTGLEAWQFRAGLDAGALTIFAKQSSQHVDSANGGDLLLYRAYLGRMMVMADGVLSVLVDEVPAPPSRRAPGTTACFSVAKMRL